MFDSVEMRSEPAAVAASLAQEVEQLAASLHPSSLTADDIGQLVAAFAAMQKVAGGALTRLAAAYDKSGRWRDRGAASAAEDLARRTGSSPTVEKRRVATSVALTARPVLDDAVRAGKVSGEQAGTIAESAATDQAERNLIDAARTESHRSFRDQAATARSAGDANLEARRRRIHRSRSLRTWTEADGTAHLHLQDLPERIAEITAALQPVVDRTFNDARREGRRESPAAYAADALHEAVCVPSVDCAKRRSSAVRPERKVIAIVDLAALHRGHLEGDETCEIAGTGPVPVAAARAMLGDGLLAVVIKDGVNIVNVTHCKRAVTAHQRTALEARGYRCEITGCGATRRLDIDHVAPWALTQRTEIDHLAWLCSSCHARKTAGNLELVGPVGERSFRAPGSDPPATEALAHQDELFSTAT